MAINKIANRAVTNVTSGGTTAPSAGTVETWTVVSSAGFPSIAAAVTQFAIADSAQPTEIITVTSVAGTTWTVTRGAEGTTPVAHAASGFTVYGTLTAGFFASLAPILTRAAVQTANYAAAANQVVPCDTTSAGFTVTLPAAPATGTVVAVKIVTLGGTNAVTVACAGSDVFNKTGGATSGTLSLLAQGMLMQYDAATAVWTVLADDLPLTQLDARYVPQAQTFALANNTYKTIQAWTVTGQTDDPIPAFSTVAGSQTYGTSPAVQGPAFWWGYNAAHLSGSVATSPHGAAGISVFADAGDSNNGAGGHGIEVNPACFFSADGSKATNALQMVAIDDNTNTVNTVIRCGTGTVNGISSAITMQNADASKTFMTMNGVTGAIGISQPVSFSGATFTQSVAGTVTWSLASSAGIANLALTAAGTGNASTLAVNAGAGTGQLIVNGNNTSTIHATISLQKSGVNKWSFQYLDPTFLYINSPAAPSGIFALWEPAGTYATSLAIFFSQLQTYDSVICGNAALATSATTGFIYLPSCAGTPTGVPSAKTGTVPCLIDTTAGKLWANIGGTWKSVALT